MREGVEQVVVSTLLQALQRHRATGGVTQEPLQLVAAVGGYRGSRREDALDPRWVALGDRLIEKRRGIHEIGSPAKRRVVAHRQWTPFRPFVHL